MTLARLIVIWTRVAILSLASGAQGQLVRQANTTLTLPASLPVATSYITENALGTLTFNNPLCITSPPDETSRLFVVERGDNAASLAATIRVVDLTTNPPTKSLYFTLSSVLAAGETLRNDGENGFLSLSFHPNFATNGTFFVFYSLQRMEGGNARLFQRVARIVVANPASNSATVVSHTPLFTQLDEATNHNGGDTHFGADGYLYVSLGDEGNGGDSFNNARFINKDFFGAILRLDVDNKAESIPPNAHSQNSTSFPSAVNAGAYKIPADNPFIGATTWHNLAINPATVRTEIYATGLRNPFRFAFDTPTGRLFCGDVGQDLYEEVDIIVKGGDYGWSWREGLHQYVNPPAPTSPPGIGFNPINPIYEYSHGSGAFQGNSITGGEMMRGNRLPELYGAYVFGDYVSGNIWALRENAGAWTSERLTNDNNIAEFGLDPRNGDVLLADLSSGAIKRLARSSTSGTPPPALLSQTGAFASLADLTPQTGIVAYAPNLSSWNDYATVRRWFSVPNLADKIGFSAEGNWTFPAGTIWIQHFDLETRRGDPSSVRRLETRFLVKNATDVYGITYRWRPDNTDADLVAEEGANETINILVDGQAATQTWRYPSRTECRVCHTPVGGFALGFKTRQLQRSFDYAGVTTNQIRALSDAGYFSGALSGIHNLPAFVAGTETNKSLEFRVRSYLAVNCVQCHQPGGAATGTWDARPATPTDGANLINGALTNNGANAAKRFVVPGNAGLSMLLQRLQGAGVPRMPPLGSNQIDQEAVQLVTDWINSELPGHQSFPEWQTQHFGSASNPDAAPDADPDFDGEKNRLEFLTQTDPQNTHDRWSLSTAVTNGAIELTFSLTANRAVLIETSTDLQSWSLWDVPGNSPQFMATTQNRTLTAPIDTSQRFFRARIFEQ